MLLSVITINKNNASGLKRTLQSVLMQTFTEFEYIIVDGVSTDSSLEVIQESEIKRNDIEYKWISEPDTGVFQAMNKGIQQATGEYLLFLNSGDFLVNEKVLETVFKKHHSADFLLGQCNISDKGKVIHITTPPAKFTFGYLYEHNIAHQATFIARRMFEQHGLYREDFRYNADIEFWYRTIILQACSTETLDIVISDYNLGGISSQECETETYKKEIAEIYSHPLLQLFIPDYENSIADRKQMEAFYWIKSKKILNAVSLLIFRFAKWAKNKD
ncbi:glycosyltransferase family 2 protein [Paludibacter jiangxiensis]|uniref:Glycosyl transferase family 2 n=1 Tax=Paludibacter jiangxiensis TaxID=681398 RepID=A0A161LER9_9BACT|nr:glycosyltransferase family 2 protein [Paludibacter jiangxiensis]GAT62867.1 glycosyl transferase family 2 [Paludibacter jiangxiensis]